MSRIPNEAAAAEPPVAAVSIEEVHAQLRTAIEHIETGEQWQAWLDFARRLHQYSFNNVILIWTQNPQATAVASYRTWQSLNRQVRRGEKALRVMAPTTRRVLVSDNRGKPVRGEDGQLLRRQQIVGFRPAPVFDIAQTDGSSIPRPERPQLLSGQAPSGLWDGLAHEVAERGYRLLRTPAEAINGSNGVTRLTQREVCVRDDVDDAQAVKTLAHELAHVMLHGEDEGGYALGLQDGRCRGVAEVEAESVAHLVLAARGVATGQYTYPYVAAWAYPLAAVEHVQMADIIARTGDRVLRAAHEILDSISPDVDRTSSASIVALTARVSDAAQRTGDLRDEAAAAVLPPVDRDVLLGVVAYSHAYFRSLVAKSWVPQLLEERRLGAAVQSHEIGYAPAGWTSLTDHLRSLGYADNHIEAAGVATRARNQNLIDRFRDRLTLPLRNQGGELVAFTARSSTNHSKERSGPKYLNSPTTVIFRKNEILYGLAEHGRAISSGQLTVVCEGPLDAIAIDLLAAQTGHRLVGVAAVGTAFTDEHAQRLNDIAGHHAICLAFDADEAGHRATEAAWHKLTSSGPRMITAANLPAQTDPAELFANDPAALVECILRSDSAAWKIAEREIEDRHLDDGHIDRELLAFRAFVKLAEGLPMTERVPFVLRLAERLHIEPATAALDVAERHPTLLAGEERDHAVALNPATSTELHDQAQALSDLYSAPAIGSMSRPVALR